MLIRVAQTVAITQCHSRSVKVTLFSKYIGRVQVTVYLTLQLWPYLIRDKVRY